MLKEHPEKKLPDDLKKCQPKKNSKEDISVASHGHVKKIY